MLDLSFDKCRRLNNILTGRVCTHWSNCVLSCHLTSAHIGKTVSGKWPHSSVLIKGMRALTHVHDTEFRRQHFNMKVTALVRGAMIHFFHRYEQQMKPAFIFSLTASIYLGLANVYGLWGYWINYVINSLAIARALLL